MTLGLGAPLTEKGKPGKGGTCMRMKSFGLEHVEFEMPVRPPRGNAEWTVEHVIGVSRQKLELEMQIWEPLG